MVTKIGLGALLCAVAANAEADSLVFRDGRYFEVPKVIPKEQGFEAVFNHGAIFVRRELVKEHFIDSAGSDPADQDWTDEEKEKLAKGLVPFEGNWIPKTRRDQIVAKRNEERQAALDEYKKHQNWRDRYTTDTKHFAFEYTVPKEVGDEYMEMFEVYYEVFAKVWKIKAPKKKLKVCFYNNRRDFERIGNVPQGVLGYFRFVEPLELNFYYARRDRRLTLDVLFHEMNHYLFHLYCKEGYQLAPWIEEGLAEYYGASTWDRQTGTMTVGKLQEGRLVRLTDEMDGGNMQGLRALMSEYNINATQYAWSWTLCHMLMENPKYRSKFIKYIEKLAKDPKVSREPNPRNTSFQWVPVSSAIDLFQKTVGINDLDAFEKDWYDYIRSLKVESARGYHEAGMFCVRWDRPVRAGLYFKKAIEELYSDNPDTYFEYGHLLLMEDKPKDAIATLEKGINLDPMNPYMWKELGEAYRKIGTTEAKEKGKQFQLLAIEMDPFDSGLLSGLDSEVLEAVEG